MNPKIILAFAGGAAVAGVLALLLTRGSDPRKPVGTPAATTSARVIEQPVEMAKSSADVAASREAVKPRPVDMARLETKLPKPAPVVVKPGSVAEPVKAPVASAPQPASESASGGVILPPFNSNPTPAEPVKREEPKRAEILKPDPVAKPAPARVPETVTIPAGTSITVRLGETLTSEKNIAGDSFRGTLDSPLVVNDMVLAERGARVEGKIAEVDRSGRVKGTARLALVLTRITLSDGQKVELRTDNWERMAENSSKRDAAKVGIMSGIGAAIGAIAGGGKGAAVGAASGAGAGTGVVLATRGKAAQIDVETKIPFRLSTPLTVTEKIN
ncbi:MAG: hypothetical protein K7J46_10425 [Bryobacter sp.]|jgi:hypothetical protein|nr:hypothetical protein [Bryobacter sp. CoA8 C33]